MSNSTFPISMLNRRDNYQSEEKRVALVGREALHNAFAQGAKEVCLFNFGKNAKEYLVIAHNGKPFDNIENQKECMKPSVTGGEGVQGNGMKASMFLLVEKNDEAELVVHSRSKYENFTTKLICTNFNDAKIEDVSLEWNEEIKAVLGEHYDKYNVYYIYRYVNANTRENKEGRRSTDGLLSPSYIRLMAEISPGLFEQMAIRARCNFIYGKLCKHKSIEQKDVNDGRFIYYPSLSKINADFRTDREVFTSSFVVEEDGRKQEFDGQIEISVYPNLTNDYSRPIVMNGPDTGEGRNDQKHSIESLFISCDFFVKNCKKDLTRATNDPYHTSSYVYDLLSSLGLYCHKNRTFDSKIEEYFGDFIANYNLELADVKNKKHGIAKWEPVVKVRVRLMPKDKNSIFDVGGLNEFFYADDPKRVRKIVTELFQEIAKQNPTNLILLRERMKKHYPYDRSDDLAPILKDNKIPAERLIHALEEQIDKDGNKSWKIIRHLNPGDHRSFIKLEFSNGKSVDDAIHNIEGGVDLKCQYDNIYSLTVSPLIKIENNKKIPIDEDEYEHSTKFLPKKYASCDIGADNYQFSFRIGIPKREICRGGGPNSKTGVDNRSAEIDFDAYQEMEKALFGIYSNGRLVLNKSNPTIFQMASFNREEFPSLYTRWMIIYEKAMKVARSAHVALQDLVEIEFCKTNRIDAESKYGNADQFFVNSHLKIIFENDEAQQLLNDVNKTKQNLIGQVA